ncbi:jupiter microtubule associated homolog 2-like [Oreochromis niloticus]|uniref:jupiter microtubule associated homolog 2-like n=1 Tax=Oreochromis niloticus TaxID=8128 RepID=UPI00022B0ED1|nr:jupiter microtubule associated homolog 2-like [Oreochromis niloticus]CAI5690752.1 unnamed protein product [Mustela putorius furo]
MENPALSAAEEVQKYRSSLEICIEGLVKHVVEKADSPCSSEKVDAITERLFSKVWPRIKRIQIPAEHVPFLANMVYKSLIEKWKDPDVILTFMSLDHRYIDELIIKVFKEHAEPQSAPRRSSPPGGKSSGIFGEPEPAAQPQRPIPPGRPTSNILGPAVTAPAQSPSRSHPNKPKDNLSVGPEPESPVPQAPEAKASQTVAKEETAPPVDAPAKEEPTAAGAAALSAPSEPEPIPSSFPDDTSQKNYEPHLRPKPRSHNRVLNPPGGKSSVVFY